MNWNEEELLSEQNIENGALAMCNIPMVGGYLSGNEAVYNLMMLRKAFEQSFVVIRKLYYTFYWMETVG